MEQKDESKNDPKNDSKNDPLSSLINILVPIAKMNIAIINFIYNYYQLIIGAVILGFATIVYLLILNLRR